MNEGKEEALTMEEYMGKGFSSKVTKQLTNGI